jgi:hypothetical protein
MGAEPISRVLILERTLPLQATMNPKKPTARTTASSLSGRRLPLDAGAVMVNCTASTTAPVVGFDITSIPDLPVTVIVIPAGMFPEESVIKVGEPAGQPITEVGVAPDSKQ